MKTETTQSPTWIKHFPHCTDQSRIKMLNQQLTGGRRFGDNFYQTNSLTVNTEKAKCEHCGLVTVKPLA